MPFDGSGTFTAAWDWLRDAPRNQKIFDARLADEFGGIATGLSSAIVKDGQTTATARIPFAFGVGLTDGDATTPAISFTADGNTGLYRAAADSLGISVGGTNVSTFSATGQSIIVSANATTTLQVYNQSSGTSARAAVIVSNDGTFNGGSLAMAGTGYTAVAAWQDAFVLNAGVNASGGLKIRAATGGIGFSVDGTAADSFLMDVNGLRVPDGTLAAPALRFTADTNTGLYRVTTDVLGAVAGGTSVAEFTSSGVKFDFGIYVGTSDVQITGRGDNLFFNGAGNGTMSGNQNLLFQAAAGASLTSGFSNVLVGSGAGNLLTSGGSNIGIGTGALGNSTTAFRTICLGDESGLGFTNDFKSVAISDHAGLHSSGTTACIMIGPYSGGALADGSEGRYPLINGDVDVYLFGYFTGKATAAARSNGFALGANAILPAKNNVGVFGDATFTDVATGAKLYGLFTTATETSGSGVTLTAAQVLGGVVARAGPAAPFTDTMPTAVDLIAGSAGIGGPITSRTFYYRNGSNFTATIAGNTGTNMTSLNTVGKGETGIFLIQITDTTSGTEGVSVQFVGKTAGTIGTDVQAWDADLDAIAALSSTGIAARTASNTWAQRAIAGTSAEITVTNGDGVSGNPTLSLPTALTFTGKTVTGGTLTGLAAADITNNQNATTLLTVSKNDSGTSARSAIAVSNDGTINGGLIVMGGTGYTVVSAWQDAFVVNAGANASGGLKLRAATGGIGVSIDGTTADQMTFGASGSFMSFAAGTTARAQIHLTDGAAPTSPANGDLWVESGTIKFRTGGVTKTVTLA